MPVQDADAAGELLSDAWQAEEPARRVELARRALALDPEAIDAYVILAREAEPPADRIALLREGVAAGRRRWAEELANPDGYPFWLDEETRPFMRAVHDLALALWDSCARGEAAGLLDQLLELNEDDHQGARYLALPWRAALGDWAAVERLIARYAEDQAPDFIYVEALDAFRRGVDARALLEEAVAVNPHVPGFLLDPDTLPPDDGTPGAWRSPEEAAGYVRYARAAWENVPGALDWLAAAWSEMADDLEIMDGPGLSPEQNELDELLDLCPDQNSTMLLSELDGYLCGLLVSPSDPEPDHWLRPIWGGGTVQPIPDDPVRSARLIELARRHQVEIAASLIEGGGAFLPIYEIDRRGETVWEPWLEGFVRSAPIDDEDMARSFDAGDEDVATSRLALLRLLRFARGDFPEIPDDEAELAPDLLPYHVETIYRRRHGLPRRAMTGAIDHAGMKAERLEPVRTGPKVGRNDPCPCGSGNKFKKCCGAA